MISQGERMTIESKSTDNSVRHVANGLLGFISADELVHIGRRILPGFSRRKLWLLVAAGLLPAPAFDLPVDPPERGLFLDYLQCRLQEILTDANLPVAEMQRKLGEYEYKDADVHHRTEKAQLHAGEYHRGIWQRRSIVPAVKEDPCRSPLFETYITQLYHPSDSVGKVAKLIGAYEAQWKDTDEEAELQLAWKILTTLGELPEIGRMPVIALLQHLDEAEQRLRAIKTDYLSWRRQVDAGTIERAAQEDPAAHGMLMSKQHRPHINKFLAAVSFFKFSGLMILIFWLNIIRIHANSHLGVFNFVFSIGFALFSIYLAYSIFAALFRIVISGRQIKLMALWDTIDYFVGITLAYASVYYMLYQYSDIGSMGVAKLSPLDFVYFSIVTVTTTGFGDIVPLSTIGRLVVSSEIIFGTLFIVIIVGIIMSRISPRAEE